MISMFGGLVASGSYVSYKDYTRYRRMMHVYARGNVLPPMADNLYEISFFPRPEEEKLLCTAINNKFANEYFVVNGEVGVGKTRLIIELVQKLKKSSGAHCQGAPVYVLVGQGTSFPETLANAVHFSFDEHISFQFFFDYVVGINKFPQRDTDSKLTRVLNAIEESAYLYMQKTGQPVVLIIDGISCLHGHMAGALEKIQDKAKMWADTNIVKVVFVNNDEGTEVRLQSNSSSWSRAATPITISDLSHEESVQFLTTTPFIGTSTDPLNNKKMSTEQAKRVFELVGGRIIFLAAFKRDFVLGVPFEETAEHLKDREQEKFVHVSRTPSCWDVVSLLRDAPGKTYKLSKLIKETSQEDVESLAVHNVVRFVRNDVGVLVRFESRLTESVVDELQQSYIMSKQHHQQAGKN